MNRIFVIIIGALFFSSVVAQHRVGFTIEGATAWQLDNVEITSPKTGGNVGIGMIYQYQIGKFLLNTGVNFSSAYLSQIVDSQHIAVPMRDTEGINFIYRGELYDRQDKLVTANISIPLMLGAKTSFGLYALGGMRINLPLHAWSLHRAFLTTKGDYGNRYHEMLEDLPQHGYFTALDVRNNGVVKFPIDLRVCAELGYIISPKNKDQQKIHVGAFVEYGVLNGLKDGSNLLTEVDCSQYMQVTMNHIYSTLSRQTYFMHHLSAGIRITFLWSVGKGKSYRVYEVDGQRETCVHVSDKKY